jgi:hypothetical protein
MIISSDKYVYKVIVEIVELSQWMISALRRLKIDKKSFSTRRKQCVNSVFANQWDSW